MKDEFISKLKQHPAADPERVKDPHRITSPASLLVDLGLSLGDTVRIVDKETLTFDGKGALVRELNIFNDSRKDFIHRSFNSEKKSGSASTSELIANALSQGKAVLAMIQKTIRAGLLDISDYGD